MPTDIYARLRDLAASAEAKPAEMRPVLLRVTTDLFALHTVHTAEEIRLYEEMAGKLIDDADEATLLAVARKLAHCADAPTAILKRIQARGGEPARELLLQDPQIDRGELRRIAFSGACDQASSVAGRRDLDREIVRILTARPEREVARAVAENRAAPLGVEDVKALAGRGRDDPILARALLDRGEPSLDVLPLYLSADRRERSRLLALALEANILRAGRPGAGVALDEQSAERIEIAATRRKRASFALVLADVLKCDPVIARRIVDDESGDALALTFRAINLPEAAAARIFLIAFPKVALSAEAFDHAMRLIRTVPWRVARRIVEAMIDAPRSEPALFARAQARQPSAEELPTKVGQGERRDSTQDGGGQQRA